MQENQQMFVQESPISQVPLDGRQEDYSEQVWNNEALGLPDDLATFKKTFATKVFAYITYGGLILGGILMLCAVGLIVMSLLEEPPPAELTGPKPPPSKTGDDTPLEGCFVITGHPDAVTAVAVSPDGRFLFTGGGRDGVVALPSTSRYSMDRLGEEQKRESGDTASLHGLGNVEKIKSENSGNHNGPGTEETPKGSWLKHGLDVSGIELEMGVSSEGAAEAAPINDSKDVGVSITPISWNAKSGKAHFRFAADFFDEHSSDGNRRPRRDEIPEGAYAAGGNSGGENSDSQTAKLPEDLSRDDDPASFLRPLLKTADQILEELAGEKTETDIPPESEGKAETDDQPETDEKTETVALPEPEMKTETDEPSESDGKTETDVPPESEGITETDIMKMPSILSESGETSSEAFSGLSDDILKDDDSSDEITSSREVRALLTNDFPLIILITNYLAENGLLMMDDDGDGFDPPPPRDPYEITRAGDVWKLLTNGFRLEIIKKNKEWDDMMRIGGTSIQEPPPTGGLTANNDKIFNGSDDDDIFPRPKENDPPPVTPPPNEIAGGTPPTEGTKTEEQGTPSPIPPPSEEELVQESPIPFLPIKQLTYVMGPREPSPKFIYPLHILTPEEQKIAEKRKAQQRRNQGDEKRRDVEIDPRELMFDTPSSAHGGALSIDKIQADLNLTVKKDKEADTWTGDKPDDQPTYPIVIWDMETCTPVQVFWKHEYPVTAISVSPSGDKFVSTDLGGNAFFWRFSDVSGSFSSDDPVPDQPFRIVAQTTEKNNPPGSAADAKKASSADGAADAKTSQAPTAGILTGGLSDVSSSESPESAFVKQYGTKEARLKNAPPRRRGAWKLVGTITPEMRVERGLGRTLTLYGAAFAPSGKQFVLCGTCSALDNSRNVYGECGLLLLWDIESWHEVTRVRLDAQVHDTWFQTLNPVGCYRNAVFSPDGKYLVAGASGRNSGAYWFQASGEGHCMAILGENRNSRADHLFTNISRDSNVASGISGHESPEATAVYVDISPDGNRVVSADDQGRMIFWNFTPVFTRKDLGVYRLSAVSMVDTGTRAIRFVKYSLDKRFMIFIGDNTSFRNGRKRTFDFLGNLVVTAPGMFRQQAFEILTAEYSPDMEYLILGCSDAKIRIWKMSEVPLTASSEMLVPDGPSGASEDANQALYNQSLDAAKGVMKFEEDTTKGKTDKQKYDPATINKRLPNEIGDPMQGSSLDSHNPLEKRIRRGTENQP